MHLENKTPYAMSWIFSLFYSWHFSQVMGLHILAGTNLKQSECVLCLNLLVVSTFYIGSLAEKSCIQMLLSPGKSGWHMQQHSAKLNEATNKNTMLRRKKTMSIIFNHLYIRSKGLCDLKTLYYQTGQTSKPVAVCILILYAKYKVYVVWNIPERGIPLHL